MTAGAASVAQTLVLDETAAEEEPASPSRSNVADKPVTEAEFMQFLFPPDLDHPSSASRLFLFARYGPLVHGSIVGGSYKRHRALTKQELNDLIEQDEREELLALFLDPSVNKSLSAAEQSAVLAETRSIPHVKDALFNYTTHEVRAFLRALRNTHGIEDGGDIPFGVLALAIEKEHDYRIEQLQEAHGSLVAKKTRATPLQRGILFKRIGMAPPHGRPLAASVLRVSNVPLVTDKTDLKALIERYGACDGLVIPSDGGGRPGSVYKAMMRSADDANAVIAALHGLKVFGQKLSVKNELLAGQELDNFMISERMLHKEAFSVASLETMNDSGIRKNLSLLRPVRTNRLGELPMHDYPVLHDQRQWDGLCCVRGQGKGTHVEGAPHSTAPLGLLPSSVAVSQTTKLNSSPHVPTVLVATHRRVGHHLHTEPEQGIHPRKGKAGSPAGTRSMGTKEM